MNSTNTNNSYSSELPEDARKRIRQCVKVCRAARSIPKNESKRAAEAEAESIERAAQTLFDHAGTNQMRPSFVSCEIATPDGSETPDVWSADDEDGDDEDDSSSDSTTLLGGKKRNKNLKKKSSTSQPMYYMLTVLFSNTPDTTKKCTAALDVGSHANKSLKDCFAALAHRRRAKNAVLFNGLRATYIASQDSYSIRAVMWPPSSTPEVVNKKRKADIDNTVQVSLPSADECVSFYANKPHLWSSFGCNVDEDLEEHNAKKNKKK